jgi:hypothetical protein
MSGQSPAPLVPVADLTMHLAALGLASCMEFYTFDSMNLVLTDLTGTLLQVPEFLAPGMSVETSVHVRHLPFWLAWF